MRAIGYLRVSTDEQGRSGLGLDAQRSTVAAAVDHRGWQLVRVVADDGASGKDLERPGITEALTALEAGDADVLVVAKLDRLSRSLIDFAGLMERARAEGWGLVALDLGVDTATPAGEMMANVVASFAQYERRLIQQRTRDALHALKARGVRLGRPVETPEPVRHKIARLRSTGATLEAIADRLNRDGVPTARGGKGWTRSAIWKVLRSVRLDEQAAEAAA